MMIVIEFLLVFIIPVVQTIVGRCYLCSEETLVQCAGRNQSDISIDEEILQYYTEPCNGQCVLFRNENQAVIRGCSWTYGHMKRKPIGWHEISPGILAYFCDSYLCNNGSYQYVEKSKNRRDFRPSTQQLFLQGGNYPLKLPTGELSSRQWRQCYSCTARFQGCGEFLNSHYASKYIRLCPTSCIIFRNPHDLHLITRDCSLFWPQVHAKSGLHKLFGSDAYFCQESLCNGISFDFIMGILHNQLSAVITFPTNDDLLTTPVVWENSTDEILTSNDTTISLDNSTLPINSSTTILPTELVEETLFNTTDMITTLAHLYTEDETTDVLSSTTPRIDLLPLLPYDILSDPSENQWIENIKPLAFPPFSWMLNMAAENQSQSSNSTTTTTTTTTTITTTITTTTTTITTSIPQTPYEYCNNQQCYHGGRLSPDCFCICLPAFTGDNCETVLCDNEPADICAITLEEECQTNNIRYLCPKFCQLDLCLSDTEETFLQ